MKNIFISYAAEDRDFVDKLAICLKERGIQSSWMDTYHLEGGINWGESLRNKVKTADGFILVMPTKTAATSNNAFFETGVARAFGKKVVVVIPDIEDVDQSNIPVDMAKAVVIDAGKQSLKSIAATVVGAVDQ